jgi:FkbM family methyltransferase
MRDGGAKTVGRRLLTPFLGRPGLQSIFQDIYEVALAGLGYGEGANPAASGEKRLIGHLASRMPAEGDVVVFDVGANVGDYASIALDLWGDRVALTCFEPSPGTFALLEQNLAGRANVVLENVGLSDTEGELEFHTGGPGSKMASVHERRSRADTADSTTTEQVQVRTLDSYCAEHGIGRIDLLKMDVEGHELSVLRGATAMLGSRAVRFVQFEFSGACVDSRVFFHDYWAMLSDRYDIYRVLAHGSYRVREYDETCEVFKRATNYLAELR